MSRTREPSPGGERRESLAVQSIMLFGVRTLGIAVTFAIPLVLVRVFSQSTFGVYKQIFLLLGTAAPLLNLGLWASLFYFVPREEEDGHRYIVQAFAILGLTGAAAAAALALGGGALARQFAAPELAGFVPMVALLLVLSNWCDSAYLTLPLADQRARLTAYAIGANDLARAVLIVGAALVFRTLEAVLWATAVTALMRGAFILAYIRRRRPATPVRTSWATLRKQLVYALPFAGALVFEVGLTRFHEYFVAVKATPAEFAIYAVGMLNLPLVGILAQSVVEVMLVRASQAYSAGDHAEVRRVWGAVFKRLALVLIPAWFLAQLLAPDLVSVLFGAAYGPSIPIFRVFLTTVLLLMVVDHGILRATGDTTFLLGTSGAGLAVSIGVTLLLAPYSILLAAMIGYVAGQATARALNLLRIGQRLELSWRETIPWGALGATVAATGVSAMVAATALHLTHPALRIAAASGLFAIAYIPMVLGFELVPRAEVRHVVRRLLPALRPGT